MMERESGVVLPSCHVCGMWIEILNRSCAFGVSLCHATYVACGLKFFFACAGDTVGDVMPRMWHEASEASRHATYVACGLKSTIYRQVYHIPPCHAVTVKSPTHKNIAGLLYSAVRRHYFSQNSVAGQRRGTRPRFLRWHL